MVGAKLGIYSGNTFLETFLAKFQNFTEYFDWGKKDKTVLLTWQSRRH